MQPLALRLTLPLADFTLDIAQEIPMAGLTALFGPSGSGKSTLLRIIAGLEPRARGRIALGTEVWQDEGHIVPPHRRGVGFVFQDTRLFPHLTAEGNLRYALRRARGLGGPGFDEVVAALDLAPLLPRRPAQLSGGEKGRVAIGRALLAAPRILLMDEPLSALDEARKAEILPYLERLRDAGRVPLLYVSHSLAEVARLAGHIVVLREGRIAHAGPAATLLSDPEAVPLLGLREAGAVLTARVAAHEADGLTRLLLDGGELFLPRIAAAPGTSLRLRLPAQDVILATQRPQGISALNVLDTRITALRIGEGPGVVVQLRCGRDLILARITRRSAEALQLRPGMACFAIVKSVAVAQSDIGTLIA